MCVLVGDLWALDVTAAGLRWLDGDARLLGRPREGGTAGRGPIIAVWTLLTSGELSDVVQFAESAHFKILFNVFLQTLKLFLYYSKRATN